MMAFTEGAGEPVVVSPDVADVVARVRETYDSGRTRPMEWRREQLDGLHRSFEVLPGRHQLQVVYIDDATPLKDRVLRTRAVQLPVGWRGGLPQFRSIMAGRRGGRGLGISPTAPAAVFAGVWRARRRPLPQFSPGSGGRAAVTPYELSARTTP